MNHSKTCCCCWVWSKQERAFRVLCGSQPENYTHTILLQQLDGVGAGCCCVSRVSIEPDDSLENTTTTNRTLAARERGVGTVFFVRVGTCCVLSVPRNRIPKDHKLERLVSLLNEKIKSESEREREICCCLLACLLLRLLACLLASSLDVRWYPTNPFWIATLQTQRERKEKDVLVWSASKESEAQRDEATKTRVL